MSADKTSRLDYRN